MYESVQDKLISKILIYDNLPLDMYFLLSNFHKT